MASVPNEYDECGPDARHVHRAIRIPLWKGGVQTASYVDCDGQTIAADDPRLHPPRQGADDYRRQRQATEFLADWLIDHVLAQRWTESEAES